MARARLKAYQVAEEIENEKDPVEDYLSRASLIQTIPASLPPLQEPRHLRSDVTASRVTLSSFKTCTSLLVSFKSHQVLIKPPRSSLP